MEKVDVGLSDQCWTWLGGTFADGYGAINVDGKPKRVNRVSYELFNGTLPADVFVLHQCDNKECVNPLHLKIGDHAENMADMAKRGRSARNIKLTDDEVQLVRDMDAPLNEIASAFGVSVGLVGMIRGKAGHRVRRPVSMSKRKEGIVLGRLKAKRRKGGSFAAPVAESLGDDG